MNIISMVLILFGNIIAVTIIYFILKNKDKKDKNNNKDRLFFIAICVGIICISIHFIYWITGYGVEEAVNEYARNYVIYSFVPINTILLIPFVAIKYSQFKTNIIKKHEFVKSIIQMVIIGIILLTIEAISFNSIKTSIYEKNVLEINKKQNVNTNEITNENKENTNKTTTYKQFLNETSNEETNSTIDNDIIINEETNNTIDNDTVINEKTNIIE